VIAGQGTGPLQQRALQAFLRPHPAAASTTDRALEVRLTADERGVELRYLWFGPSAAIRWPEGASGAENRPHRKPGLHGERRDFLWHHTCGEWFIGKAGSPGYIEFNFSPSGHWAAHRFADYRQSLGDLVWKGSPPEIEFSLEAQRAELRARVPWAALASLESGSVREWQLGLSCVVERNVGVSPPGTASAETLEYWAVNHPRPQPEFHDRRGFSVSW
jgi:hypothetical protein